MDAKEHKFERSRKKFRQNLEREKQKVRRTIFLEDDERPSTSKGGAKKARQQCRIPQNMASNKSSQKSTMGSAKTVYHRCLTVVDEKFNAEPIAPLIIVLSDDEEQIPPPPPLFVTEETFESMEETTAEDEYLNEPRPPLKWMARGS